MVQSKNADVMEHCKQKKDLAFEWSMEQILGDNKGRKAQVGDPKDYHQ